MKQIRRHFTYANVMSSIAVFLILGGATAMAAKIGTAQLKAGSVKTGKIAKEAVKAGKLAKNAVSTPKIANGAVTTDKIADNAVTGAKVDEATLGEVPKANTANTANTATVGAPAAYAQIEAGGGIDENEPSRGISDPNVTNAGPGIYCVDLAFAPQTASGNTVPSAVNEDGIVSLELGAPYSACPDTAEAEVRVFDAGDEAEDNTEDIWVQFDS